MVHLHDQLAHLGFELFVFGFQLAFAAGWTIDQGVVVVLNAPSFDDASGYLMIARRLADGGLAGFDLCDHLTFEFGFELSTDFSHYEYQAPHPRTENIRGREGLWKMPLFRVHRYAEWSCDPSFEAASLLQLLNVSVGIIWDDLHPITDRREIHVRLVFLADVRNPRNDGRPCWPVPSQIRLVFGTTPLHREHDPVQPSCSMCIQSMVGTKADTARRSFRRSTRKLS